MAVFSIFVNSPAWMRLSRAFFLWRSRSPETSRLAIGDCSWFMVFGSLSGRIRMKIDFVVVFDAIECESRHPSNQRVVRRSRERFYGFLSYLPSIDLGKVGLDVYREVVYSTNSLSLSDELV